jgi:primase-polymerase (primpol)-like protein
MIDVDHVPAPIRASHRIVLWKHERRGDRLTKVPYQPARPTVRAAVDRPRTWGTFPVALVAVLDGRAAGLGIVLGAGLVGVDLDHCRVAAAITDEALAIVRALDSYSEVSPSGTGVHVLMRGTLPAGGRRKGPVEMYSDLRFFTVTGAHVAGTPATIEERTAELAAVHRRIFGTNGTHQQAPRPPTGRPPNVDDAQVLERARAARNGGKFRALWSGDTSGYPSHSEADQALCTMLAFWTGGDAARMDALFRRSALMRPKWDAPRGAATYGQLTIHRALR